MTFDIPKSSITNYLQRRYTDLENFRKALTENDTEIFLRVGHQIKGNGVTFGFPVLSDLGEKMESAAKAHNYEKLKTLVTDFESELQTATKTVETM